nr:10104_t:CDS:2 [Entrophospora candida]
MSKNNIQRETIIVPKPPTVGNAKEVEFERLLGQIKIKIIEYEQKSHGSSDNSTILSEVLYEQVTLTTFHNLPHIDAERISTIQKKLNHQKDKLHQIIGNEELRKLCELKGAITELKMREQMDAQFQ